MQNDPKTKRPSPDQAEKALHDLVEAERERGEINTGAEPNQKSEVEPRERKTD